MERKSKAPSVPRPESEATRAATLTAAGLDAGDVSLIRWMLTLTPAERLEAAQDFADGMAELRDAREIGD